MKLFVFFVTVLAMGPGEIASTGSCTTDDEDCTDGSYVSSAIDAEKRMIQPDNVVERRKLLPRAKRAEGLLFGWKSICVCEPDYNFLDFGEGHYPRYVATATCPSNSCSNNLYECRLHYNRVYVLAKRGMNSIPKNAETQEDWKMEELTLPDSLQDNWQMFALSLPVTCVTYERK